MAKYPSQTPKGTLRNLHILKWIQSLFNQGKLILWSRTAVETVQENLIFSMSFRVAREYEENLISNYGTKIHQENVQMTDIENDTYKPIQQYI